MESITNTPSSIFDVGIIIILLVSGALAYTRGFVHEIFSVIGWVGAIFATIYGFPSMQPIVRQYISISILADFLTGAIIFLSSLILLWFITHAIAKRVQSSAISMLDKSLGFLFGIARGAIIICILYIGVELILPKEKHPKWMTESRLSPIVFYAVAQIKILIPDNSLLRSFNFEDNSNLGSSKQVIEELLTPKPKLPKSKARDGYGIQQRREIERLIDGSSNR